MYKKIIFYFCIPVLVHCDILDQDDQDLQCPQYWVKFQNSCYRFIKSPRKSRNEANRNCQAYEAELASVSSPEEHGFLVYQLSLQDPQHRRWYIGARQQSPDYWINDGDGSSLNDLDAAFLNERGNDLAQSSYLVYKFSNEVKRWGFEGASGEEELLYICELPITKVHYLVVDDRTYQYGVDIKDPSKIPHGPYFIKQPVDVVFDLSKIKIHNYVTLSCLAGGYPTPTYDWYKEDYVNDVLVAKRIDPLSDERFTISGGTFIINSPRQVEDRGSYHCKASNDYGTIISETVTLSFGSIGDFNLKRPPESGNENWGKAIACDPPQHFPGVIYHWTRDYFPNFVEEDKRVFVSFDGALYFSALETIDQGNYSCSVQSQVSDTGRNGPFFPLRVLPNSNYQQLKFPNNFPKAFPEAPIAGKEVRLECVAFGYPVPSYNWTRKGASLPRSAKAMSFNRVLIIPHVNVEDQGEYVCRAYNGRSSIEHSVQLNIQAEPNFTIPLTDKHVDNEGELTWTCEAFGIPDVTYSWFRDGNLLQIDRLPPSDQNRYAIQDNVLTIKYLNAETDPAMFQCRAQNNLKIKYSSAQLRVLTLRPTFRKHPLEPETYAGEGGNVTIKCDPEAAPRPKFKWIKDGNVIGSGGRRKILENGNLIIAPVSRDDDGMYTCIAENMHGTAESQGRLIVLRGPSLLENLPPKIVTSIGKSIYLQCKAVTVEMLDHAFIWTHNGIRLFSSATEKHRVKIDGGYLEIINVTFSDSGDYECSLKSTVGRVSTQTTMVVEGPPGPPGGVQVLEITKNSAIIQWTDGATHGKEISHYLISGRTPWNNTWVPIAQNIIAKEVDRYNGRKEAQLENVLTPYSLYEFVVQAGNILGLGIPSLPSPKYRTRSDKPYKVPDKISGGGGKIGDLIITWEPLSAKDQNGPGIYYKIFWKRHGTSENEYQSQNLTGMGNVGIAVVRVPLEDYYTQYDVKVQASNADGAGPISNTTVIYSAEDMPQVAPQQVSARPFNSTSINVTWTPIELTREKIRGKLIGHRLKYWKQSTTEENAVYYLSRSTRPWSLIVGLQPNTYYFVKVMAYNSAGEGPESERFLEKTYRKAPQKPPSSVNVYGIDPSTVRVLWRYVQPSLDEEPVIGYKVRVWEIDQDMSTANDTIVPLGSVLEAYVINLTPGKTYHMRVLAFSNGGDGRMSSPTYTFQMGDEALFRNYASRAYYNSLYISLLVLFYHFFV
ncbi:contactin [Halyomorpha halys]|uniref:contactin n=1 Tax=Halyomorpha halys TaxID=286706 RepID=UPI0006D5113A|nr:contactin [Halyomorpha halys]